MPRKTRLLSRSQMIDSGVELATETYTRKVVLPDGRVLASDGAGLWLVDEFSYYGRNPPPGWDEALAVPCLLVHEYEVDVDYS